MSADHEDVQYRQQIQERVQIGDAARSFLGTKLGQYLMGRAEDLACAAMADLKNADPTNPEAIRSLQNAIFRAESFELWINEAINDQEIALDEIQGGNNGSVD